MKLAGDAAPVCVIILPHPLLSSHGGRSVALAAWLLLGWFLVQR